METFFRSSPPSKVRILMYLHISVSQIGGGGTFLSISFPRGATREKNSSEKRGGKESKSLYLSLSLSACLEFPWVHFRKEEERLCCRGGILVPEASEICQFQKSHPLPPTPHRRNTFFCCLSLRKRKGERSTVMEKKKTNFRKKLGAGPGGGKGIVCNLH